MHDPLDEVLEEVWALRERGVQDLASLREGVGARLGARTIEDLLSEAAERGLLRTSVGTVAFTPAGEEAARGVIRRHRLAEVLFRQVLSLPEGESEESACELEHMLSTSVTDAVCAFLGHPPHCPHGLAIPRGECCRRLTESSVRALVVPLSEVAAGRRIAIVYISSPERKILERLGSLGVVPGARARVVRTRPAGVLEIGETSLALDRDLLGTVFVRETD